MTPPRPDPISEHGAHAALVELAWDAAHRAGHLALEAWAHRAELEFTEKASAKAAHADIVSVVDAHAEAAIVEQLLGARPQDRVLGEEGGWVGDGTRSDSLCWIVDPIDGTLNYRYGRAEWAVSVAAVDGAGRSVAAAVYAPARREAFTASPEGAYHHHRVGSTRLAVVAPPSLAHAVVELGRGGPSLLVELAGTLDGQVRDLRRGGSAALALCDVAAGRQDAAVMVDVARWDTAGGELVVDAAGGQVLSHGRLVLAAAPELTAALAETLGPLADRG